MGKRRRQKKRKTWKKKAKRRKGKRRKNNLGKKNQRVWWVDLPQDIQRLILGKLPSAVDVIRFRAVCKSWHIADIPKDHRNLPWLCNFSWSKKQPKVLECEMYDPYSRQIFKTSEFVKSRRSYHKKIICLGSKQGWLIAAYRNGKHFIKREIFMFNPYTKHFISLPFILRKYYPLFATFTENPVSSNDSRVFLILSHEVYDDCYIACYGLNGDKEWEIQSLVVGIDDRWCCGMQYINEQLFCLFENGRMIRYKLADKSQAIINLGKGSHQLCMDDQLLWLAKGEGDLLVACELDRTDQHWTFYFDWPSMSWVGSDLQESSAVFINDDDITTFVRPFQDKDDVENNKGCKVYSFDISPEPSGYSFAEMRRNWKHSFCTVFMEPPRIN